MAWEENFLYPLILLLIGAGISGGLVTWLTNRWQNHRKELEIKTDLASKMAEAMALLDSEASLQIYLKKKLSVEEQNTARQNFKKWFVEMKSIHSKLEAYFPDTGITKLWDIHLKLLDAFVSATQIYFDGEDPVELERLNYNLAFIKNSLKNVPSINVDHLSAAT
jgi:hypothetical protein